MFIGPQNFSGTSLIVKNLGIQPYDKIYAAMQEFTRNRESGQEDEIWILQHPPVFTLGRNGKEQHVLNPGEIPLQRIDRGGQVTYHGPGQIVGYLLIDIRRIKVGVREMVSLIEDSLVDMLAQYEIEAYAKKDAPGVYTDEGKIAALGLRISKGCTYHGLSLNIKMNLEPFSRINPCGYEGLNVVQLADYVPNITIPLATEQLVICLKNRLAAKTYDS